MRSIIARRVLVAAALLASTFALTLASSPAAGSAPAWASASSATIHPGVQLFINGGQCTANFVYTSGSDVYIGMAAHCAGTGEATDTNGCDTATLPIGTPVRVSGASRPGALAYSSWRAMQTQATRPDLSTCSFNDLALVRIHPDDVAKVNPSIPHWGGPTGLNTGGVPALSSVYSSSNSILRLGLELLMPKAGLSLGTTGGGWAHPAYTITPGIPGDSGSGLLDSRGRATGVLSTLVLLPTPLSNNHTDLNRALSYAAAHGGPAVSLALGTEPFRPNQLPLDLDFLGL